MFQAQPTTANDIALYEWAGHTLRNMEDGENEANWNLERPIPASFEEWRDSVENVGVIFYLKVYIIIFFFQTNILILSRYLYFQMDFTNHPSSPSLTNSYEEPFLFVDNFVEVSIVWKTIFG